MRKLLGFFQYIAWREENDVDDAINWDVPQDLLENFQYKITGLTQEGGLGTTKKPNL